MCTCVDEKSLCTVNLLIETTNCEFMVQCILMSIVLNVIPGVQQKKFLPFGHGRDLVAFNSTGLCTSSSRIGPR